MHVATLVWTDYEANNSRACRGCHQFSKEVQIGDNRAESAGGQSKNGKQLGRISPEFNALATAGRQ
jgi:nitrate/TMAO reductase-like tetraheme cytochrome c subunit